MDGVPAEADYRVPWSPEAQAVAAEGWSISGSKHRRCETLLLCCHSSAVEHLPTRRLPAVPAPKASRLQRRSLMVMPWKISRSSSPTLPTLKTRPQMTMTKCIRASGNLERIERKKGLKSRWRVSLCVAICGITSKFRGSNLLEDSSVAPPLPRRPPYMQSVYSGIEGAIAWSEYQKAVGPTADTTKHLPLLPANRTSQCSEDF